MNAKAVLDVAVQTRLNCLIKGGINFSFITGRDWISAYNIMRSVEINRPVSVYNGAAIMDFKSGRIIKGYYLPCSVFEKFLNLINIQKQTIKVTYCEQGYIYKQDVNFGNRINNNNILSIAATGSEKDITFIYENLKRRPIRGIKIYLYDDPLDMTIKIIDIVSSSSSKGIAGYEIANLCGIGYDNTIAFGNAENDREMLESAGLAIGIGDIPVSLRQHIDFHLKYDGGPSVLDFIVKYISKERRG